MQSDSNENSLNSSQVVSTIQQKSGSSDSLRKLSLMRQNKKENPVIIDQKYLLLNVIYQGKASTIFDALNIKKQQACVVRMIVTSKRDNSNKVLQYFQNQNEIQYFKGEDNFQSGKINSSKCFTKLIDSGTFMNQYNYQVLEKTGPNLKFWYNFSKNRLSDECIILIILRSLQALQLLHEANFIHSNLTMQSLMTSLEDPNTLLLGNFQETIVFKPNSIIVQKCQHLSKYSSLSQHLGSQLYPKDDLESLLYIVCQLITDGEFFEKSKTFKKRGEKLKYYFQIKSQFLPEQTFRDFPQCFTEFANKIRYLNPNETQINYDNLKATFKGYKSLEFDWAPLLKGLKQQSQTLSSKQLSQGELEVQSQKNKLETIMESVNEHMQDTNHRLFKNQKSFGDNLCDIHPDTQESDGEISFEEESTDKSNVYCFK